MPVYALTAQTGEHDYEVLLHHETTFTEAEFFKKVFDLAPEATMGAQKDNRAVGFQDVIHPLARLLCERYGFTLVDPIVEFAVDFRRMSFLGADGFTSLEHQRRAVRQAVDLKDWLRAHDLRSVTAEQNPKLYRDEMDTITEGEKAMRLYLVAGEEHVVLEPVDVVPTPKQRIQIEAWWPFWKEREAAKPEPAIPADTCVICHADPYACPFHAAPITEG
jgi:hypothetical protein